MLLSIQRRIIFLYNIFLARLLSISRLQQNAKFGEYSDVIGDEILDIQTFENGCVWKTKVL
ncbi:hypothetical protein BK132_09840 [Paenibacillus sp. FSL H8-0259]|nr:hypothetical protein BK132_09840 [Paenibacillus sp. FSL H8-0259]